MTNATANMPEERLGEDGSAASILWKAKAERLADYVADWLDYQEPMAVAFTQPTNR